MRAKGIRIEQVLMAGMLLAALCWNLAQAAEIKQLRVDAGPTGTRAEIQLDRPGAYKVIELRNPERLVVDFPDSRLQRPVAATAAGAIQSVRTGQPEPGTVRLVFDLASAVKVMPPRIETGPAGPVLVLEWPGDDAAPAVAPIAVRPPAPAPSQADPIGKVAADARGAVGVASGEPSRTVQPDKRIGEAATISTLPGTIATGVPTRVATGEPVPATRSAPPPDVATPAPAVRPRMQGGMRPLVVAIDAGHGGQDPGAHGPRGTREKDVTLAIARELARQVNATPGLKAFLTRDNDVYIPLGQRARRATANKADIFVSIHADAAENRSARGSSVYVLSTRGASSQRARWLADKENASDIIGGERARAADNTLTSVLLDLTQSGNMKASEDAADHVLNGLKRVGNNHKPDVERANFAVLRTSDKMPAMLVETAFISNADEEARLTDPGFQRTLASAILDGVDRYFARQPPPGTLYAARARAAQDGGVAGVGAGGSP